MSLLCILLTGSNIQFWNYESYIFKKYLTNDWITLFVTSKVGSNWSNNSRKFGFVVLKLIVESGEHDWWFIANTYRKLRSVKIWMLLLKLFHLVGSGNKADFYRCGEIMISKFPGVKYKADKWYFVTKIVLTYCEKKMF